MAMSYTVATLVGSLRKASLNRKVARALVDIAPPSLKLEMVGIGGLALYNAETDDRPPGPYVAFREQVAATHAVMFVTPEYNRSLPGALKDALDVGSRPYGHSVWARKPAAIVSASPGAVGGFGANHHLRQSLVFLDMPTMQQPEAYLTGADDVFDANGTLINDTVRALLVKFMQAFALWIAANSKS